MQNVIQKRHSKWEKVQLDEVEPVCPYVSVGADDPDVGEALALLAQFGHARDVRVVTREELHPGGHRRRGGGGRPRHLDLLRGVPVDVHQHGHDEVPRMLGKKSNNLARKCYGFNFLTCKVGNSVATEIVRKTY